MSDLTVLVKKKLNTLNNEYATAINNPDFDDKTRRLMEVMKNPSLYSEEKLEEVRSSLHELNASDELIEGVISDIKLLNFLDTGLRGGLIKLTHNESTSYLKEINGRLSEVANLRYSPIKKEIARLKEVQRQLDNNEYVDNIDLIFDLISELPNSQKLGVLKELYSHNRNIRISTQEEIEDIKSDYNYDEMPDVIDFDVVAKLLKEKYNYDIDNIEDKYKQVIRKRADINRITGVLDKLKEKNVSLDISDKGECKAFVTLLIKGDPAIMEESFEIAKKYGQYLSYNKLMKFSSALIKQRNYVHSDSAGNNRGTSVLLESGAATNFQKNVAFFAEEGNLFDRGWTLDKLFDKCGSILIQPYAVVAKNLKIMDLYGINLDYKEKGCNAVSALKYLDFDIRVDKFIEIDADATNYIKHNLSRLLSEDLVYRLQYCARNKRNGIIYDPYRNEAKTQLKGEMTKLPKENIDNKVSSKFLTDSIEDLVSGFDLVDLSTKIDNYQTFEKALFNSYPEGEIDKSIEERPEIMDLDLKYRKIGDELVYNMGDVRLSRTKALRIYKVFVDSPNIEANDNALLFSLTYKSLLNQDQLDRVKNSLNMKNKVMI